jgi:hypothetical protein
MTSAIALAQKRLAHEAVHIEARGRATGHDSRPAIGLLVDG